MKDWTLELGVDDRDGRGIVHERLEGVDDGTVILAVELEGRGEGLRLHDEALVFGPVIWSRRDVSWVFGAAWKGG